jgi:glutamate N-acetyltransferase / amino-acid N-acetyltransferase
VSVTYPKGFRAAGVRAGLKPSGLPDLGLLVGVEGTAVAGLFTTNAFAAAPVVLSRERLAHPATGGMPRATLVNSGQANAATGEAGLADAERAVSTAATLLGLDARQVLPCSTGVIGEPVHMQELLAGLPEVVAALSPDGGDAFASSILTTDTVEKQATEHAGPYRIGGCAKGVGMISPNLATMLAFVTTDALVTESDLDQLIRERLGPWFGSITVDGCPSTNDTVLLFASGAAGGERIHPATPPWDALGAAVSEVGESLARQLIADGEGATHVLVVDVSGAADELVARTVAMEIADSPLVKAAVFGADPNPGRLVQAIGAAGALVDPSSVDVWLADAQVVRAGVIPPAYFGGDLRETAVLAMKEPEVRLRVRLGDGDGTSLVLGCDLSYEYVRINGEYTT